MIKILKSKNKTKYISILTIVLLMLSFVVGCTKKDSITMTNEEIKELVNHYSTNDVSGESASITSEYLIVPSGGIEKKYKLPKDEFFVSIAPYIEKTHP